jgi:hypothetical protein
MATKYLAEGSTTFASPAWSGGALADTDDAIIEYPFDVVATGLDQSGFTEGLESFWIKAGATAGQIGGNGAGSFTVDIDNSSDAFFANDGNVTVYLKAGGDEGVINNAYITNGANYFTGGTFTNVTVSRGVLNVNESTVVTNMVASGGSGTIEYNATAITSLVISGGVWTIRRAVTTLIVTGNALVYYDPNDSATISGTAIQTYGGRLIHIAGATPTITNRGGIHDFSQARRAFTPGATSWTWFGTRFVDSPSVATTNRAPIYGAKQVEGGMIPL